MVVLLPSWGKNKCRALSWYSTIMVLYHERGGTVVVANALRFISASGNHLPQIYHKPKSHLPMISIFVDGSPFEILHWALLKLARATGSVKGIAYFTWAMGREWLIFQNVWRELEYFIVLWNDSQLRQRVRNCENIVRECCFQLHRCIFQYFCALAQ